MRSLTSASEASSFVSTSPLAMLKFSAQWCGPCKAVAPAIEALAPRFPTVAMGDVDIDENQETAQEYQVTAVPTFVFLHKGIEIDRVKGGDVVAVTAALKKLSGMVKTMSSGGFGSGHRLGDDVSVLDAPTEIPTVDVEKARAERALRASKLEAAIRKRNAVVDEKSEPTAEPAKGSPKPAKPAAKSGIPGLSFVHWIVLYVLTLFSIDARASATSYARRIKKD